MNEIGHQDIYGAEARGGIARRWWEQLLWRGEKILSRCDAEKRIFRKQLSQGQVRQAAA